VAVAHQRRDLVEGALHLDQAHHFAHRIDVGLLQEALRHPDALPVDDRLGPAFGDEAGIAETRVADAGLILIKPDRTDQTVALPQRAVLAGPWRARLRIELDRGAARVQHRSEEDTSELQSREKLGCRARLE